MSKFSKTVSAARVAAFGLALLVLSACGTSKKERLAYVERPAELIYNQAVDKMDNSDWDEAKLLFQEVERQHPFSKWARRSMLMSAYASYRTADYDESVAMAQRFIGLHPGSDSAPYAYYLIAINYYDQSYVSIGVIQEAKLVGSVLGYNYPNSEWYKDSYELLENYGVNLDDEISKPRSKGTGETGAGKSILLDALGMATGARSDRGLVRSGTTKAQCTASFTLPDSHSAWAVLDDHDIEAEKSEDVTLRRTVTSEGRSRAFVNDQAVSVKLLSQLGAILLEVHGCWLCKPRLARTANF